jgi:hypothetical protein
MQEKSKIQISSNRSFGIVFFIVFLAITLWFYNSKGIILLYTAVPALIFLVLGLLNSKLLSPLNFIWHKFGILLGAIIAPIVMALVYFLVVTPTGLIMKILGKDLLQKKFDKKCKSYWIEREKLSTTMKRQF